MTFPDGASNLSDGIELDRWGFELVRCRLFEIVGLRFEVVSWGLEFLGWRFEIVGWRLKLLDGDK